MLVDRELLIEVGFVLHTDRLAEQRARPQRLLAPGHDPPEHRPELRFGDRLQDVIGRAFPDRLDGVLAVSRHEYELEVPVAQ